MSRVIILISGDCRSFHEVIQRYKQYLIMPNQAFTILDTWEQPGEYGSVLKVGFGRLLFKVLLKILRSEWRAHRASRVLVPFLEWQRAHFSKKSNELKFHSFDEIDNVHLECLPNQHQFKLGSFEISAQTIQNLRDYSQQSGTTVAYAGFRNMLPMFYKIWSSYIMYEKIYGYNPDDILVRIRPDLILENTIDCKRLLQYSDEVVFSKVGYTIEQDEDVERVPDQFFIGKAADMKKVCSLIKVLELLVQELLSQNKPSIGGEFLMKQYLSREKISYRFLGLHSGIQR